MRITKTVLKLYLYHLILLVVIFVSMGPLWMILDKAPILYSIATTWVYGCVIYSVGWNCGKKDGRKIPGSFPQPKFPLAVSAFASIIPVCLFLLCFLFPDLWHWNLPFINGEYDFLLTGNRLQGVPDFLFKVWYFPFGLLLGNKNFVMYLLGVLVLPILFTLGYFVGLKNFKLLDVIEKKLLFSNKKEK